MSLEYIHGNEIEEDRRLEISRIFASGFYEWLRYFSKDMTKLALAFQHAFVLENFYVAILDGKICGMAACTDGKTPSVKLDRKELCRHLGFIRGLIASVVLKKELENHPYPFPLDENCGSVEFVAVDKEFRRQKIAFSLISHIFTVTGYQEYVLEAADTNLPAVQLYTERGFTEFMKIPHKYSKQSGINNFLYLKYTKQ